MSADFREARPPDAVTGTSASWPVAGPGDLAAIRGAMTRAATPAAPRGLLGLAAAVTTGPDRPVLAGAGERVGMVFSELATNALRHARGPVVASLARVGEGWLVAVEDGAPDAAPGLRPPAPARSGGHGLRLVVRLARAAGWYRRDGVKCVWAEVGDTPPEDLLSRLRPAEARARPGTLSPASGT